MRPYNGEGSGCVRRSCGGDAADLYDLPDDCIFDIISVNGPRDACRLASVSRFFLSAAQSDVVWERFLPVGYQSLVPPSMCCLSKKQLYLALCDYPLLIDGGKKSFWLEKWSGKKCYMLSARDLKIVWTCTPRYWRWISLPEARFPEIAELIDVCWLEIRGKMNTGMLSPETRYAAYLVFKTTDSSYGLDTHPMEAGVGIVGNEASKRTVWLDSIRSRRFKMLNWTSGQPLEKKRGDGWTEIELGEFFNKGGDDEEIEMSLLETKGGHWKSGLIVQGMEIRPKQGN